MWNRQLYMSIMKHYGLPLQEQVHVLADAGFDGIFSDWYCNPYTYPSPAPCRAKTHCRKTRTTPAPVRKIEMR